MVIMHGNTEMHHENKNHEVCYEQSFTTGHMPSMAYHDCQLTPHSRTTWFLEHVAFQQRSIQAEIKKLDYMRTCVCTCMSPPAVRPRKMLPVVSLSVGRIAPVGSLLEGRYCGTMCLRMTERRAALHNAQAVHSSWT